ncbi:MAG: ribosome assembly cofactor RimP [Prolixibacteraceae bacterium]|jgi:ribosome maturation factor RimP|nr:ribosome assembly cofactor RimP [Prolixibacteraceae bacterium]
MIEKGKIIQLAEEKLDEGQFLVEVSISASNVIQVVIDGMNGVTINKCVEVSRNIEHNLDRETEDFELQVMSAGLGQPFKVYLQYVKNENREVEVATSEGVRHSGIMMNVNDLGFDLQVTKKEKGKEEKHKQLVTRILHFNFEEIKEAKNIIKF